MQVAAPILEGGDVAIQQKGQGLNQGVDYAEPAGPQTIEGGLNQGVSYVAPEDVTERLVRIRALVDRLDEVRKVQDEQQRVPNGNPFPIGYGQPSR
jgi:hypothetical protein